jgi:hypothetical protein
MRPSFPDKDVCSYALDFETQPLFLFINGSFFLSSSALHPKKKKKRRKIEKRGGLGALSIKPSSASTVAGQVQ